MFTGLVESVGTLVRMERKDGGVSLVVAFAASTLPVVLGESIAVQGACLTVTGFDDAQFRCDVLDETLRRTNLADKRSGHALNLERALQLGDRLGGHMVTGHVDAVGTLDFIRMEGRDRILRISCTFAVAAGIVEKGSVALDGISLTVSSVNNSFFEVNVIPWTWEHTSLQERTAGDSLNIETDMIGKYIQRHLTLQSGGGVNEQTLADAGFSL